MEEIRIMIESTWRGPERKDGVCMWLVEYLRRGEPITRQGFVHVENGTEIQGNLQAMSQAFSILKKPCCARVMTRCEHLFYATQKEWISGWEKAGWINARGKPVKNSEQWKEFLTQAAGHSYMVQTEQHEYTMVMQADVTKELEAWKTHKEKEKNNV